ncbi:helix-turn-helix domain-containing protein [Kribbella sp. NPDC051952]|uniref:TetR/AcrR family transcriptional regulator n=1 Tax=Kribbella sp. NPDC051952 TaxID=3154851 RepID=UPI0034336689
MTRNLSGTSKPTLSPDQILKVAVSLADREGLESVSMRRLGRELSASPMGVYWHFKDKDSLLDAMTESVIALGGFDDVTEAAWDERLRRVLLALVAQLREHPWMGRLVIERLVPLPKFMAALEIMLDSARQAGLSPHDGAMLTQLATQAVVALVDHAPDLKAKPPKQAAEYAAERDELAELAAEQYPNIRTAADALIGRQNVEDYYRLGIDMIVLGIGAVAHQSNPSDGP